MGIWPLPQFTRQQTPDSYLPPQPNLKLVIFCRTKARKMEATKRLQYIFRTMEKEKETLPSGFVNAFYEQIEGEANLLLRSIKSIIQDRLFEHVDQFTGMQFETLLTCMAGSPEKEEVRLCLSERVDEDDWYASDRHPPISPLEALCNVKPAEGEETRPQEKNSNIFETSSRT